MAGKACGTYNVASAIEHATFRPSAMARLRCSTARGSASAEQCHNRHDLGQLDRVRRAPTFRRNGCSAVTKINRPGGSSAIWVGYRWVRAHIRECTHIRVCMLCVRVCVTHAFTMRTKTSGITIRVCTCACACVRTMCASAGAPVSILQHGRPFAKPMCTKFAAASSKRHD